MDNSCTGLVTKDRAGVKTGLDVYLAAIEKHNLLKHNWSIFRAGHKKVTSSLLQLYLALLSQLSLLAECFNGKLLVNDIGESYTNNPRKVFINTRPG